LSAIIIAVGIGAYFFKQMNQHRYGFVEALFGASAVFAVAFGISPLSPTPSQLTTMVGSAYVIARGLNNWAEATKAGNKDFKTSRQQLRRLSY
jgi:hypothetical protein